MRSMSILGKKKDIAAVKATTGVPWIFDNVKYFTEIQRNTQTIFRDFDWLDKLYSCTPSNKKELYKQDPVKDITVPLNSDTK